mgnify:FL=1
MKSVVITGSTRGIGHGLAENFLERDCRVVISGRSPDAVAAAVADLGGRHGADRVAGRACEITDNDQVQQLWDAAVSEFGRVDIWVNNAGISSARKPLAEADPADIARVVDVTLTV